MKESASGLPSSKQNIADDNVEAKDRVSYGFLAIVLLIALVFRLYWMATKTPVISIDGAEYVRMAENLRAGHGLVGNFEGPETMYTPFYSVLTALVSPFVRSAEFAAHLVSLVFGTCLILPVFLVTRRLYGLGAAYIAATLVAFHPLMIAVSGSTFGESIYPTLLMFGVYWGMLSLDLQSLWSYGLCGAFFACAYLTRPEAFAYPIFFALAVGAMAVIRRKRLATAAIGSVLVLASFLVVASPYIAFLHAHTGQWRLEGKWNINYTAGTRIRSGQSMWQALYGIDDDQQERGSLLDPLRYASYTPYPHALRDKLRYMISGLRVNREDTYATWMDTAFGQPFLLILVAVGLFGEPWTRRQLPDQIVLLVMALSIFILMLTAHHVEFRYAEPLLSLSLPWAAKGVQGLGQWGRAMAGALAPALAPRAMLAGVAMQLLLCIPMLTLSFVDTQTNIDFKEQQAGYMGDKQAGLFLRSQPLQTKRIMSLTSVVPYYAQGIFVQFPYAGSPQTLRYMDSRKVDFVILEGRLKTLPTIGAWLSGGVPSSRAQLIFDTRGPLEDRVEVYRWHREKDPGAPAGASLVSLGRSPRSEKVAFETDKSKR